MGVRKIEARLNARIRDLPGLARFSDGELGTIRNGVDQRFREFIRRLFATEGASSGRGWPALSPAYAAWKRRHYPGRKIMVLTGRLRRSLTERGHAEHVARFGREPEPFVQVGTAVEYAAFHAPAPPGGPNLKNPGLPDRDTLDLAPEQAAELVEIWRRYLVEVKIPRIFAVLRAASVHFSRPGA